MCERQQRGVQSSSGKTRRKKLLGRPRHSGGAIVKMDHQKMEWEGMGWIDLVQDRDSWRAQCECGNGPSGFMKCGEFVDWLPRKDFAPWCTTNS
jgi:hypothetical protein